MRLSWRVRKGPLRIEPLLVLCLAVQETRTESWPSGARKAEYEVARDERGAEVKHGAFRSFHEDGTLESEGAFEQGRESGAWTFFHPNGARAAFGRFADGLRSGPWETFFPDGSPESQGSYVRGARSGRWTFWRADGTKDLAASGIYRIEVHRPRDGERHYRGYFVDNLRQGTWTSYWPDGTVQLEGHFEAGKRSGRWVFAHPDGTPSALLLSGEYQGGAWAGQIALPEPPPFDRARFPAIEPAPGGWPERRAELAAELRMALAARSLSPAAQSMLASAGLAALPVALELLRELDPESPSDRAALGFLEDRVLRPLCAGHSLSRHGLAGSPDAPAARELVRAWLSLWALTRTDHTFWKETVPGPSRGGAGLRDVLQDPPLFERDPRYAPEARPAPEAEPAPPVEPGSDFALRFGKPKEEALRYAASGTKESVALALAWLAGHQSPDGRWSNAGFSSECGKLGKPPCAGFGKGVYDVGATGLALLAFLGDGHTAELGDHRELVRRGLDWLVRQQNAEGLIGARETHDFLYGHAIATAALCEAAGLGDEAVRAPAERAIAFLQLGRHPEGAWRYDVPATELGDTSVTGWAVSALLAARRVGLAVDDAALAGALAWIERMSEPRTGRIGYTDRGELSARTPANEHFPREMGEAMTAVGLLCRLQLGQRPTSSPILVEHAKLLAFKPMRVDPQWGSDQYYWYYATCALHELGAPFWDSWEVDLRKSVILTQQRSGDARGSWDPVGPWGDPMGRVCATALLTLALECPYRYPRALATR
jgi:antitoxin component YwqK of YwqJK toxin-antitoxin module